MSDNSCTDVANKDRLDHTTWLHCTVRILQQIVLSDELNWNSTNICRYAKIQVQIRGAEISHRVGRLQVLTIRL